MVTDIYSALMPLREIQGDMKERIKSLSVWHVFEKLDLAYADTPEDFNSVLFYILDVYSVNSECVVVDGDWQDFKKTRFDACGIRSELLSDVVLLHHALVRDTIRAYVDFQEARDWSHICMLQDLYVQFKNMAVSTIDMSVEDKYKCAKYAKELVSDIDIYKNKMVEKFAPLAQAEKELPKPERKKSLSLQVEDFVNVDGKI